MKATRATTTATTDAAATGATIETPPEVDARSSRGVGVNVRSRHTAPYCSKGDEWLKHQQTPKHFKASKNEKSGLITS